MHHSYKDILNNVDISEIIILAFPLYVDSPNTITLKFLDYIYDNQINLANKSIYVIINCGFSSPYDLFSFSTNATISCGSIV